MISLLTCLKRSLILAALFILIQANAYCQYYPKTEMRAIWIATVNNIDWPSKPGLSAGEQKAEMISLLDLTKKYNLNTVIFQVRPAADAFYRSELEPWSQWLGGEQGKAPEPDYDPLEFVIEECRKRGLDIHAWLNPYRAVTDTINYVSPDHITSRHPEWFVTYGRTLYFDPGLQEIRDWVAGVVSDIVRRYDVDAIHMDDYFYPYRIAGVNFPDDSSFVKNPRGFTAEQKEEWRRDNVNLIIRQISDSIRSIKPWVEFGISPFGVWRNSDKDPLGSNTKAGVTNYDDLYADILLWQKNRWIDYVVPQIYWHIGFRVADYSVLSDWWSHNTWGSKLYIGHAPYRIARKAPAKQWRTSKEITKQISLNRTFPTIGGSVFFSGKVLRSDPLRVWEKTTKKLYRYPALPPSNLNVEPVIPVRPEEAVISVSGKNLNLSWVRGENTKKFVVYKFIKGRPADLNNPANIFMVTSECNLNFTVNKLTDPDKYFYMVASQSWSNTESEPVWFKWNLVAN